MTETARGAYDHMWNTRQLLFKIVGMSIKTGVAELTAASHTRGAGLSPKLALPRNRNGLRCLVGKFFLGAHPIIFRFGR